MCTREICMYTGQRHRSVLINSAMYTNRATLVFSRANHVAKAVSFFFFLLAFWTTRLWWGSVAGVNHVQVVAAYHERFFRPHSVIFSLHTRKSCLRDNFGPSFIIVILKQNDCKCCTMFAKPCETSFNVTRNNTCKYILLFASTVCRSCIVKYLQDSEDNKCPACSILIHETNPFEMLRY